MECSVIEWQLASNPKFKAAIEKHYVAKSDLRKLVKDMRTGTGLNIDARDSHYWADRIENLLNGGE